MEPLQELFYPAYAFELNDGGYHSIFAIYENPYIEDKAPPDLSYFTCNTSLYKQIYDLQRNSLIIEINKDDSEYIVVEHRDDDVNGGVYDDTVTSWVAGWTTFSKYPAQ